MATRRSLIALGGLFMGGGAIVSTGAFNTVEAQRSVAMETAGDSNAFLSLEVLDSNIVDQTDGTIEFELMTQSKTRFEELVDVRNRGTQTVESLRFEFEVTGATQSDSAVEDALKIISGSATIDATDDTNLLAVSDAGDAGNDELAPGEAVPFGIEVDLTGSQIDSIDGDPDITLTIIADTEGSGGSGNGSGATGSIGSISLAQGQGGNDIDVTVNNVSTSDPNAELRIQSIHSPGSNTPNTRDQITVSAADGTYTVLGANQADRVRVILLSSNGTQLDSKTKSWSP